jgi:hypothetical protein
LVAVDDEEDDVGDDESEEDPESELDDEPEEDPESELDDTSALALRRPLPEVRLSVR